MSSVRSIPDATKPIGVSFVDDALSPGGDSATIRQRRPQGLQIPGCYSGKSLRDAANKAAEMGYLDSEDCDGKEPDGDALLKKFQNKPEAIHALLDAARTGRMNEHLHKENRQKGGYLWALLLIMMGMTGIFTGVIFGALIWNKEIVIGPDGQLYNAHGDQSSVLIRNQAAPALFTGVSLVGPPLAKDAVSDAMCGDPSVIPFLASGQIALSKVKECVLDPSLTCTFCDTCDGDVFQTFQVQSLAMRVPEYDMATGTATALVPSADLMKIDGTYLSASIQYLHENSLENDFLLFCDAEQKVCYDILANCWGWFCEQDQGGTASFCASRRERQRQLLMDEENAEDSNLLKLTKKRRFGTSGPKHNC